jgi:hypothetical protein
MKSRHGERPGPHTEAQRKSSEPVNAAGPHASPDLTDHDKTPGCGMLPEPGDQNASPTG